MVTKPPEADKATQKGAAAFATYFLAQLNSAYQTLDPSTIDSLSKGSCVSCRAYARSLRRSSDLGERWVGGLTQVEQAVASPIANGQSVVLVTYNSTDFTVYDRSGAVVDEQPAERRSTLQVQVERRPNGWVVRELAQL